MFKIIFFAPESECEMVKNAAFEAGAGRQGLYDFCSWQVLGQGQFRPLKGSQPHIGELNKIENVAEYRVEMLCDERHVERVLNAIREAHPYEEPAIEVIKLDYP